MTRISLPSLLIVLLYFCFLQTSEAEQPNVLIIYGDDQGSIDLGCFGVEDLQTPHLDQLAGQGLKLTQMYAPAPVCSASRIGLLTGRFPARAGQPANGDLGADEVTIAEIFRDGGYRTGHVGKWHLGRSKTQDPAGQGFENWFGHLGGCIDNYSHFFYWNGPNRHDLFENGREIYKPGLYFPDLMVERCKSFIDGETDGVKSSKPWLLYWAFNAPHYPYQGSPKWLESYRDLPTPRREYCAFLSTMDDRIGEVLHHLEQNGLSDNTIVIYQPDHGHSTETRAFGGGGNAGPYRGAKFSLFEGGIRVPAIIRYPGKLPAGKTRSQFVTACDWLPTLAEFCDVQLNKDATGKRRIDGVSITRLLKDDEQIDRGPFYWQFGSGADAQWAVRDGDWKLIANPRDTSPPQSQQVRGGRLDANWFLVDLTKDPGERDNRANVEPARLKRMIELGREIQSEFN